ncbi:MAG TPA: glycosyltransferase family 1 protein [Actinomycetota bacterium]|nr:glycosyltransferase family 1 protein [Actinomycetota bacterium]
MRALIDARPALDPRRTGVGVVTDRLIRHLPADAEGRYGAWYLHARGLIHPRRFYGDVPGLREFPSRIPARVFGPLSSRVGWPRVGVRADVFLATNFLAPPLPGGTAAVLLVHDLAFLRHPETAPHMHVRWRRAFRRQLGAAAAVIVPSSATREDLVATGEVDAARVHVVPLATDPAVATSADEVDAVRRRYAIGGPYALFVGGLEPRKNLVALVEAFAALEDGWLVIVGGGVPWFPDGEARVDAAIAGAPAGARARIVRTGYVGDAERRALLAGAAFLAYPSLAEGFGLPVLEAFAAGIPVLTSDVSSLPEVAGDAALLVHPDPGSIADGLAELFADPARREALAAAGRERVRGFTWDRTAAGTAAVLHGAAGTRG